MRISVRVPHLVPLLFLCLASAAHAQEPGDIYREFTWRANPWQRIVGHDATHPGARALLPNRTNRLTIADLEGAVRAEVQIEKLTSHAGSAGPQVRFNSHAWRDIPWPGRNLIPGKRGDGGEPVVYMMMYYPKVPIPLSELREGTNRFDMRCTVKGSHGFAQLWPQFIIYGVTVRVYYKSTKPHTKGVITGVRSGDVLGGSPTFGIQASGRVSRVDYVGDYDHFDYRGDDSQGWQRSFLRGEIQHHIGRARSAPWSRTWDTSWVPMQTRPFRIAAFIRDSSGVVYVSPAVTGLTLSRSKTVMRYRADKIQWGWVSNYWRQRIECFSDVTKDLENAEEARLFMTTWNGYECEEIGVNDRKLVTRTGRDHEISWDQLPVSLSRLKLGRNQLYTYSRKQSHGIEVQWPGIEIFVRYDEPERHAQFAPFGASCRAGSANPALGIQGRPVVGQTYALTLAGGVPGQPVLLTWGVSNARHLGAIQLPVDLTPLGAPGCLVWSSIDATVPYTADGQGRLTIPVDVPPAVGLAGTWFFNQLILVAPGRNRLGTLTTNSARTLIGRQ